MTAGKLRETKMKKILLMLIIFYSSMTISYAEKLPENLVEILSGGPETYVPYRQYFAEYTERLSQAFEPKGKFPWRAYNGTTVNFLLHSNGSISNLKIVESSTDDYIYFTSKLNPIGRYKVRKAGPKMDKYAMEVIMNNPPKPFLTGMDYTPLRVEVQIGYYPKSKEISYTINSPGWFIPSKNIFVHPKFTIYLCRDSRKIKGD